VKIAMIGQKGIPATFGGIEYHVDMLSRELAALGHEVTVYARRWYSPPATAAPAGVRRIYVPTIRTKHLDATVHSFLCSIRAAGGGADIVHFHAIGPGFFSPIPRLFGKRIVTTIHRLDWAAEKWKGPAKRALKAGERLSAVVPHARIVVSQDLQNYLRDAYGAASVLIPQGMIVPVLRPPRLIRDKYGLAGGDYILFMGRLSPEKRVDGLIRAFQAIVAGGKAGRGVKLVVAGGTSATDRYVAELMKRAAGTSDIIFTGYVAGEEKDELLTNALLFVLPSSVEGRPIALLEARNHGLGCLASDIPPHREVIREGEDGQLFRSGDFDDLAAKLAGLIADRPRIARFGERARVRMSGNASWGEVARRTAEVYAGVRRCRDISRATPSS
jgi:glycosyltransferase involved in cell wall biosynthesis